MFDKKNVTIEMPNFKNDNSYSFDLNCVQGNEVMYDLKVKHEDKEQVEFFLSIVKKRLQGVLSIKYIFSNDNELSVMWRKEYKFNNLEEEVENAAKAICLAWNFVNYFE